MIIYHLVFILVFSRLLEINMRSTEWTFFAKSIQITFISLVGVSLSLTHKLNTKVFSSKKIIRLIKIGLSAILVTGLSLYFTPNSPILFGILHFITIGSFLCLLSINYPKTNLFIGILLLLIPRSSLIIEAQNPIFYIIGVQKSITPTLDYFPLLDWLGLIYIGSFIGYVIKKFQKTSTTSTISHNLFTKTITFISKHSLIIYLLHIPITVLILWATGVLTPPHTFRFP